VIEGAQLHSTGASCDGHMRAALLSDMQSMKGSLFQGCLIVMVIAMVMGPGLHLS